MIGTDDKALRWMLRSVEPYLMDPATTDFCINRPGEAWVKQRGLYFRIETPFSLTDLEDIAMYAAGYTRQEISRTNPRVVTKLPHGHRTQIVMAPCVVEGTFSLSARKPSTFKPSIDGLDSMGLFRALTERRPSRRTALREELRQLYLDRDIPAFLKLAVRARLNFYLVGRVGAGKTTLATALADHIDERERVVKIEDNDEIRLSQPNSVGLVYSKGAQGSARVSAQDLMEDTTRMDPSWVLVGELRDRAAWMLLRSTAADNPTISTGHGDSPAGGFEALRLMVKTTDEGRTLDDRDIFRMLNRAFDVVIHCDQHEGEYSAADMWFAGVDAPLCISEKALAA